MMRSTEAIVVIGHLSQLGTFHVLARPMQARECNLASRTHGGLEELMSQARKMRRGVQLTIYRRSLWVQSARVI